MRPLSLAEVIELHRMVIEQAGGLPGLRDLGALESAVAQPRMTFGGTDLYPSLVEKSAALCLSQVKNHPFVDGNNRVGHAAMETLLVLNGFEIEASTDEQEQLLLALAVFLSAAGATLWLWSFATIPGLGSGHYVLPEQRLITSGPCARVRHPIYLAAILLWITVAAAYSTIGMLTVAVLYVIPV